MVIQVDSREKVHAITKILEYFDAQGIKHPVSKLMVGDYMNLDNPRVVVDRKQNLTEVCSNVCQQHERFRAEMMLAKEYDIQLVFLVEHGGNIRTIEDVFYWQNPRLKKRTKTESGEWVETKTKAMTGERLYQIMQTMSKKYGVKWEFCDKRNTGKRIVEILEGGEALGS